MKVYVDAKELLAAAKFCDDKKNKGCREILRCVHVESNENDYALVSTDSYKLIKFVHNNTNPDGTNDVFTCNIGIDIIKESVKTTDDVICIEYDEETLAVTLDIFKKNRFNIVNRASVKTTANNGTYPQYNKLLEKDVKRDDDGNELPKMNGIRLNTAFVEETCKYIQLAYGKKTPIDIELGYANEPALFNAVSEVEYNDDGERIPVGYCNGLVMPIRK